MVVARTGSTGSRGAAEGRRRLVTTALCALAFFAEVADEQITPALFLPMGKTFELSPSQLGVLTLSRALVQAVASFLTGYLATKYRRVTIIGAGCISWGVCTFLVGSSVTYQMALAFSALNGVGLAVVIPSVQSTLADYYPAEVRGATFGSVGFVSSLGGVLGGIYATNLGARAVMGRPGWRFVFHSTGVFSLVTGFAVLFFAHEPPGSQRSPQKPRQQGLREHFGTLVNVCRIPSFRLIILQGVFGTLPWNALAYMTLWFQLLGFTDWQASLMRAIFAVGQSLGLLLGGILGDISSQLFPSSGRILIAQTSVASGLPLSILLFRGLPQNAASDLLPWYAMTLAVMGLSISWPASACNSPVFADIVPPETRTSIYAFDRSFEGAMGAFGTPAVGAIAQFAFGMSLSKAYDKGTSLSNARALSDSLLVMLLYPWTVCLLFYFLLHVYYKKDRQNAQARKGAAYAPLTE